MARYIDAEKLKRNIRVNLMPNVDVDGTVTVENAERYFLNLIDKTSTADVAEVKHGQWWRYGYKYECSICRAKINLDGTPIQNGMYYCPNCGARMDGGNAE